MSELTVWGRLRRYLLTGVVVIAPVGVTAFVLYWIFIRIDAILGRLLSGVLGRRVPGLGLMVLVVLLIVVGWVAQQALGRQLIRLGKRWLLRFPLTAGIYNAASQIIETLIGSNRRLFKSCVLVEYPRKGCWSLGFLTNQAASEISDAVGEDSVAIFVPTTPNPTSGLLVFLPRSQVRITKMGVEDGFKLVISGGAVTPEMIERSTTLTPIHG